MPVFRLLDHSAVKNKDIVHHYFPIFSRWSFSHRKICGGKDFLVCSKSRKVTNLIVSLASGMTFFVIEYDLLNKRGNCCLLSILCSSVVWESHKTTKLICGDFTITHDKPQGFPITIFPLYQKCFPTLPNVFSSLPKHLTTEEMSLS